MFELVFEHFSPFLPVLGAFLCLSVLISCLKRLIFDSSFSAGFCGEDSSKSDESDSKQSYDEDDEQEKLIGEISVYSVLLDKEIFHWEGDYAKEIKKDRLTVYYTDDGINKSFSCDLDDHIVVKEP